MYISDKAFSSQVYLFLEKPPEEGLPSDITVGDVDSLPEGAVYVGPKEDVAVLAEDGYTLERFSEWIVAVPPER